MITIKEFSMLCECNIQTLRYYDRIGLLKPARVDDWTGYRYYNKSQAFEFIKIKNLQAADFSISEIKELMNKSNQEIYEAFSVKVVDKENGGIEVNIYDMLNELKAYKNLDVYVTGSNSKGLSNDIATEFRGRASQIHVYPLSFKEFCSAVSVDESKALDMYMLYGGMPRITSLDDEKDKKEYLSSLYRELYIKDIVERNGIEREDILNDILDFLASQISSLTNPTNISNVLASMKNEKINPALVSNYVRHIMDSFLISEAKRYDVKGKTYFKYPNKYYYTDMGLRNARLNYRQFDPGHLMENIIYNELLRRGIRSMLV